MTISTTVIPSPSASLGINSARNLLLNHRKANSSAFAPKEVLLGDGFGMTGDFDNGF
jgi:hypothetical protein